MEVVTKIEMFLATRRRYVVHRSPTGRLLNCTQCGQPMVTAEQAAATLGINQRRLFQIIEAGGLHYAETPGMAMMICLTSLANFLDSDSKPAASAVGE